MIFTLSALIKGNGLWWVVPILEWTSATGYPDCLNFAVVRTFRTSFHTLLWFFDVSVCGNNTPRRPSTRKSGSVKGCAASFPPIEEQVRSHTFEKEFWQDQLQSPQSGIERNSKVSFSTLAGSRKGKAHELHNQSVEQGRDLVLISYAGHMLLHGFLQSTVIPLPYQTHGDMTP